MGKKAWRNLEKGETKHYYRIFLKNGNKEITAKVKKANCRAVHNKKTKTYAEVVMQTHPKIEQKMIKLCQYFAQCNIEPHIQDTMDLFEATLVSEIEKHQKLGKDASYKYVEFKERYPKRKLNK